MKKIYLIFIFLATSYLGIAQSITRSVISSAGAESTSATAQLSWTLGELSTATLSNSTGVLTQGFQQTNPIFYNATATVTNVTCNGGNDGAVFVSITGGTAPYSDGTNTYATDTFTISGLSAGAFSYTITDNNGATSSISGTITQPSPFFVSVDNMNNVNCNGGNDGAIDVSSNEVVFYSQDFEDGTHDFTFVSSHTGSVITTNPGSGTYSFEITGGTTNHDGFEKYFAPTEITNISFKVNSGSNALSDSYFVIGNTNEGFGAGAIFFYARDNGQMGVHKDSLISIPYNPNQWYDIEFKNIDYSTQQYDFYIDGNLIQAGIEFRTPATSLNRFKLYNYHISTAVYDDFLFHSTPSYTWSNNNTGSSISGLSAGNYTVTATDFNGCTADTTITITEPTAITSSAMMSACSNGADGQITVTASGGMLPLQYSSDNGATYGAATFDTTNVFTGLAVGSYDIVVKDANGCTTAAQSVSVTSCFSVAITNSTDVTCPGGSDGTISIAITGGTPNFSINNNISIGDTTFTFYGFSAGLNTLTVMDQNGLTDTVSVIIGTTPDNTPPTVITQDITVQLDASGNATITTADINNGSTDNCGISGMSLDITAFTCANIGANTVTLSITDVNGSSSSNTATVTVVDNINPVVVTQNITVQLDATGNASITTTDINNGSSDNCGISSMSLDKTSFSCSDVGANTVTLTVTDVNGNSASNTATVTVVDNINPTVVTQNITVQLDGTGNASITTTQINNGSTDNCSIATMTLDKTAFDCTNVGANTVTLTVTDANGNTASNTATVTIEDNLVPNVVTQNITVQLDATGNASITTADINNGSTDNCGVASMSLDVTSFDCTNVGANTVTLTVTDVNGNPASASATVTVEDNVNPTVVTQDITIQLDATGNVSITTADIDNGSTDNCGIASMTLDNTTFDCTMVGANTVTLTVTDVNGNVNTATAVVTLVDLTPITVLTRNLTIVLDGNGQAFITPAEVNNGTADNCDLTFTLDQEDFDCSHVGTNTVTLTATTNSGQSESETATITVVDNEKPSISCKDFESELAPDLTLNITNADVLDMVSDNCSIASVVLSQNRFDVREVGANTVTLTATDVNGNQSSCQAQVNIKDFCLTVPQVFSPNNDGINDTWDLGCIALYDHEVRLFNRWGQMVYQDTNFNNWNGIATNGEALQDGAYNYIIIINYKGKAVETTGAVNLVR